MDAAREVARSLWRNGANTGGARLVPEETPVAITYNRMTHAVMMATPADLEDFAIGFSLTERVITTPAEIEALEIVTHPDGIEARMDLDEARREAAEKRRRRLAGPTGCGLCGIDSLAEAVRPAAIVSAALTLTPAQILQAMADLADHQTLGITTRAVHAAGFWRPDTGLVALREDVGRHNALDKLAGALARTSARTSDGAILLTSRVSVEMVQKAAAIGASILIAVSAPTALALRIAEASGITLVAIARQDGFEVFTHAARIAAEETHAAR